MLRRIHERRISRARSGSAQVFVFDVELSERAPIISQFKDLVAHWAIPGKEKFSCEVRRDAFAGSSCARTIL